MLRLPLFATAAAIILFTGYVHGLWTGRWGDSSQLELAVARLEQVPKTLGDWHGEDQELESKAAERAGFRAYLLRGYKNQRTGQVVTLLLGCGPFGLMSVHTPDICYRGAGFSMSGKATKYPVPSGPAGAPAEFWMAKFTKGDAVLPTRLHVFWSWNASGAWQAPNNPRWSFAGAPALYKLYLISQTTPGEVSPDLDPCKSFMQVLLPELQKVFSKL